MSEPKKRRAGDGAERRPRIADRLGGKNTKPVKPRAVEA
jgi:hypothetical protein